MLYPAVAGLLSACLGSGPAPGQLPAHEAPRTEREPGRVRLHGESWPDPYRWLEAGNDNAAVADWRRRQNRATHRWLAEVPGAGAIRNRLGQLWDYRRFDVPRRFGQRWYFFHNRGMEDHYALYTISHRAWRQWRETHSCSSDRPGGCDRLPDQARLLLDPDDWPEGQSLAGVLPSPDGERLLYAVSRPDQRRPRWHLLRTDNAGDPARSPGFLDGGEPVWAADGSGVYHVEYAGNGESFLRFRDPVEGGRSRIVHAVPVDHRIQVLHAGREGRWLVLVQADGKGRSRLLAVDLQDEDSLVVLRESTSEMPRFVGSSGSELYFERTGSNGFGRIDRVLIDGLSVRWQTLVPEQDSRLHRAVLGESGLLVEYLDHGASRLAWYSLEGRLAGQWLPPDHARIEALSVVEDGGVYGRYSGIVTPDTVMHWSRPGEEVRTVWRARPPADEERLYLRRVFVDGNGERPLPVYIAGSGDPQTDSDAPLLLEAYGGFDLPVDLSFSITRLAWLEMGGRYAIAVVRGGGEYGRQWHRQGRGLRRRNSIEDILAVAGHLQRGNNAPLAAAGGSHGATLMAAAAHQRPGLFAALLLDSGVLDLLRYPRLGGEAWLEEYGDPARREHFRALWEWSPYRQAVAGVSADFPPSFITTRVADPVVAPAHSFKYAAALQYALEERQVPVMLSVRAEPGHREDGPVRQLIDDYSERWGFLARALGLDAEPAAWRD